LRDRRIAMLCAGLALSAVGDQLYQVAVSWVAVNALGSSAGYLSALQAATFLVVLLIGSWVDRYDERRVMIVADLARAAFQLWSEVANLTFVETTGTGQITLDDTQSGAFSSSNYGSNGIITSATVNVEPTWYGSSSAIDSYTLQTFIHEIGHALGLGHAGPYNGSATYGVDNTYANDTWQYTIMSYMEESNFGGASDRFTMTPMMADILAIQNLYGASNVHAGDTVYGFGSTAGSMYDFSGYSQAPALTIYDSGGIDTLNASGYSQNQVINLAGGSFSNIGGLVGNVGIYTTSVIENAIGGSGNDTITGNSAANVLTGGGGNDTLNGLAGDDTLVGGTGNDTMVGGTGNDTYYVDSLSDVVTENSGEGTDTVYVTVNGYTLAANVEIGRIALTTGATLTGNALDNTLYGNSGTDTLDGGAGTDTVVYSGLASNYQLVHNANGTWTTTDLRTGSPDGTDTLVNIEQIQFSDTLVSLNTVLSTPTISSFSNDSGTVGDNITNDNTLTLTGAAAAGNTVSVYDGATLLGTAVADGAGTWTFTTGSLTDATHSLTAIASDGLGHISASSISGLRIIFNAQFIHHDRRNLPLIITPGLGDRGKGFKISRQYSFQERKTKSIRSAELGRHSVNNARHRTFGIPASLPC